MFSTVPIFSKFCFILKNKVEACPLIYQTTASNLPFIRSDTPTVKFLKKEAEAQSKVGNNHIITASNPPSGRRASKLGNNHITTTTYIHPPLFIFSDTPTAEYPIILRLLIMSRYSYREYYGPEGLVDQPLIERTVCGKPGARYGSLVRWYCSMHPAHLLPSFPTDEPITEGDKFAISTEKYSF